MNFKLNRKNKERLHLITYKGITAEQSNINYHINMWDAKTGKRLGHLACTEPRTKRGLKKDIRFMVKLGKMLNERDEKYDESETKTESV